MLFEANYRTTRRSTLLLNLLNTPYRQIIITDIPRIIFERQSLSQRIRYSHIRNHFTYRQDEGPRPQFDLRTLANNTPPSQNDSSNHIRSIDGDNIPSTPSHAPTHEHLKETEGETPNANQHDAEDSPIDK